MRLRSTLTPAVLAVVLAAGGMLNGVPSAQAFTGPAPTTDRVMAHQSHYLVTLDGLDVINTEQLTATGETDPGDIGPNDDCRTEGNNACGVIIMGDLYRAYFDEAGQPIGLQLIVDRTP